MMSVLRSENNSWLEAELAKAGTSLLVQQQRLVEERGDKVMADLVQQLQHQVDVCVDNREQSLKRSVLDQLNTQVSREIDNRMNFVTVAAP